MLESDFESKRSFDEIRSVKKKRTAFLVENDEAFRAELELFLKLLKTGNEAFGSE